MAKKGHGQVLRAGLDAQGDYFPAAVLKEAVDAAQGKPVPVTMGFDPKRLVGDCFLEWDAVAKSITMRTLDIDPMLLERMDCAAAGELLEQRQEGEIRYIDKFQMTSVGLFPPGKKTAVVKPEE